MKSKEEKVFVNIDIDDFDEGLDIYDNDLQLAIEQSLQDTQNEQRNLYELIPSKPSFLPPNYIAPPLPKKLPYPPIWDY